MGGRYCGPVVAPMGLAASAAGAVPWKTATMSTEPGSARWPAHFAMGALRVVRWSARYEETVAFYRDTIGLPVQETFHDSYGLDGTILGCQAARSTWRSSVRRRHLTQAVD